MAGIGGSIVGIGKRGVTAELPHLDHFFDGERVRGESGTGQKSEQREMFPRAGSVSKRLAEAGYVKLNVVSLPLRP